MAAETKLLQRSQLLPGVLALLAHLLLISVCTCFCSNDLRNTLERDVFMNASFAVLPVRWARARRADYVKKGPLFAGCKVIV